MKSAPTSKVKESDVQKAIIQWLDIRGYMPNRINSGAMTGRHNDKQWFMRFTSIPGTSDILACQPGTGKLVAIEVKEPSWKPPQRLSIDRKTRLSKLNPAWTRWESQRVFLEQVMANKGIGILARSLDDVMKVLEGI